MSAVWTDSRATPHGEGGEPHREAISNFDGGERNPGSIKWCPAPDSVPRVPSDYADRVASPTLQATPSPRSGVAMCLMSSSVMVNEKRLMFA